MWDGFGSVFSGVINSFLSARVRNLTYCVTRWPHGFYAGINGTSMFEFVGGPLYGPLALNITPASPRGTGVGRVVPEFKGRRGSSHPGWHGSILSWFDDWGCSPAAVTAIADLRKFYFSARKPRLIWYTAVSDGPTLALHIRQQHAKHHPTQLNASTVVACVRNAVHTMAATSHQPPASVALHVFSEGGSETLAYLQEFSPQLHLSLQPSSEELWKVASGSTISSQTEKLQLTFHHMVAANGLIVARSTMSWSAALMSKGRIFSMYSPDTSRPDWFAKTHGRIEECGPALSLESSRRKDATKGGSCGKRSAAGTRVALLVAGQIVDEHSLAGLGSIAKHVVQPLLATGAVVSMLLCTSENVRTNASLSAALEERSKPLRALTRLEFRSVAFAAKDPYERHSLCFHRLEAGVKAAAAFVLSTRPDLCLCGALPPVAQWSHDSISSRARLYAGMQRLHVGHVSLISATLGRNRKVKNNTCPFRIEKKACLSPDDMLYIVPGPLAAAAYRAQRDSWPLDGMGRTVSGKQAERGIGNRSCPGQCQDPCHLAETHLGHAWQTAGLGSTVMPVCATLARELPRHSCARHTTQRDWESQSFQCSGP